MPGTHCSTQSDSKSKYSCCCVHLHSDPFSPRHIFYSATVNISAFFFSSVLLCPLVYSERKRWRESGEKDRQWGHPQQISTNDVSCRSAVSMPRLCA